MYQSMRITISPERIIELMGERYKLILNRNYIALSSEKARELSCLEKALRALNISSSRGKIKCFGGEKTKAILVELDQFEKALPSISANINRYALDIIQNN